MCMCVVLATTVTGIRLDDAKVAFSAGKAIRVHSQQVLSSFLPHCFSFLIFIFPGYTLMTWLHSFGLFSLFFIVS